MLCYRSSRKTNEVVKDSMAWLVQNRRLFRVVLWPVIVVCTAILIIADPFSHYTDDSFEYLVPFRLFEQSNSDGLQALYYAILTFVATLVFTPLLIRYFIQSKSIRQITISKYCKLLADTILQALLVSLAMASAAFIIASSNWFLKFCLLVIVLFTLPQLLMYKSRPHWRGGSFISIVAAVLYILFISWLIQDAPYILRLIIELAIELLNNILPGFVQKASNIYEVIQKATICAIMMMYCIAVMVFETCALILHGTLYTSTK